MDQDRIEGVGHKVLGGLKEKLGKIIGDVKLQQDGAAERQRGEVADTVEAGPAQVAGVDTDRLMGIGHQLKGAMTQGIGNVIGDPELEAKGRAERAAGKVQNAAGGARDEARDAEKKAAEPTEADPK